jgi:hypothetical protein
LDGEHRRLETQTRSKKDNVDPHSLTHIHNHGNKHNREAVRRDWHPSGIKALGLRPLDKGGSR